MSKAHGYFSSESEARHLALFFEKHLAGEYEPGTDWLEDQTALPINERARWRDLLNGVQPEDVLLIEDLQLFKSQKEARQAFDQLTRRGVRVVITRVRAVIDKHTVGLLELFSSMGRRRTFTLTRCPAYRDRAIEYPLRQFKHFKGYGLEVRILKSGKRRLVLEPRMRRVNAQIVHLRKKGRAPGLIAATLNRLGPRFHGRKWTAERISLAYRKELALRQHEANQRAAHQPMAL